MTREELIEVIRDALWRAYFSLEETSAIIEAQKTAWPEDWDRTGPRAIATLAALEAAGVRLVYVGEAKAQLIDGDERTRVSIFTPYAQKDTTHESD